MLVFMKIKQAFGHNAQILQFFSTQLWGSQKFNNLPSRLVRTPKYAPGWG